MTKRALILGITGQDGSYLAEFLLGKGYEVHGIIRRASTFNTHRIDHLYQDPHEDAPRMILHYGELSDGVRLLRLLYDIQPDEVYNLAAQSHVRVSFDEPVFTGDVTGLGASRLLEAVRMSGVHCRYYQASTSELYGATPPPQDEDTPFHPRSPYGAAKLYAYWMTRNYREAYDMYAVNGILFNHESPRRGETFVTRKITRAVARIKAGTEHEVYLGNLDAIRDWGYAPSSSRACGDAAGRHPRDYVLATGSPAACRNSCRRRSSTPGWTGRITCGSTSVTCDPPRSTPWSVTPARPSANSVGRRACTPASWLESWSTRTSQRWRTRAARGSTRRSCRSGRRCGP